MTNLVKHSKAVTMTSLELVDFINSHRDETESTLRHDDFLRKVPIVLGEEDARKFTGNYKDSMNRKKPCYVFPKREACLMAMSYSYDLQAKVFDRMTELETKVVEPMKQMANPTNATRAHLMVVSMMQKIGVRKEMAMAVALQAIHEDTGLTTEPYRLALPSVDEPANLNQTQLGELLGINSRAVGDRLRDAGLMVKDESGNRVVTEAGLKHGEMKPFSRNGHSGYEPRWKKSVLSALGQVAA